MEQHHHTHCYRRITPRYSRSALQSPFSLSEISFYRVGRQSVCMFCASWFCSCKEINPLDYCFSALDVSVCFSSPPHSEDLTLTQFALPGAVIFWLATKKLWTCDSANVCLFHLGFLWLRQNEWRSAHFGGLVGHDIWNFLVQNAVCSPSVLDA